MNKKLTATVLCIAVGVVMLFSTAFASLSGTSGYETYKTAIKNMVEAKSFTATIEGTFSDNGKELAKVTSVVKANHDNSENMSSSSVVNANGQETTIDVYAQDGKSIVKSTDSDIYYVSDCKKEFKSRFKRNGTSHHESNPEAIKAGEMIIDTLVGNIKNYFTVDSKANGGSEVSVSLSDNQIPTILNAFASLGVKNIDADESKCHKYHMDETPFCKDLKVDFPKLVEDVRVENISLKADISKDNIIENQIIHLEMSGKDAQGIEHTLVLDIKIALSDLNATTPAKIDLTGKTVETVDKDKE